MLNIDSVSYSNLSFQAKIPTSTKLKIQKMKRLAQNFGGFSEKEKTVTVVDTSTVNSIGKKVKEILGPTSKKFAEYKEKLFKEYLK